MPRGHPHRTTFSGFRFKLPPELQKQVEAFAQASIDAGVELAPNAILCELIRMGLAADPKEARLEAARAAAFNQVKHWAFEEIRKAINDIAKRANIGMGMEI